MKTSIKILSINSGSSSLKFKLYEMPSEKVIVSGLADRIGDEKNGIFYIKNGYTGEKRDINVKIKNHTTAVKTLLNALIDFKIIKDFNDIDAVGHRVVQGGNFFSHGVIADEYVEKKIEDLIQLAPLHNKANLIGIKAFKKIIPNALSVTCFDTAFHQTMSAEDYLFPIPYEYYEKYNIRRYGAHGISHNFLAQKAKKYLKNIKNPKIISCHLGNGGSITAIKNFKCIATSMGLTPLGGIMMGTRCGDIDPSVFYFLMKCTNNNGQDIYEILNKKSGFLGVSGISNDSRDIIIADQKGISQAQLSNALFVRRVADYIGQYFVRLGGCDLIIFSGGIGENSSFIRERICAAIKESLGISIDKKRNDFLKKGEEKVISNDDSKIKIVVIPTDEELMIAKETYNILKNKNKIEK
ncbi:MAG: acetate kinase [Bacilli bacterium]|nr:acetate kinase [Bacilli bacterium]